MRVVMILLSLVLGGVVLAGAAVAHTELAATIPEADSVVEDPPIEVVLEFTSAFSDPAVRVIDPNGDDLVAAPPTQEGSTVTVPLNLAVAPGEHQVDWAITAADGDEQTGSFAFTFQPPPEVATPEPLPEPTTEPAEPTETATASEPESPEPTEPTEPTGSPTADPSESPSASEPVSEAASPAEDDDGDDNRTTILAVAIAATLGAAGAVFALVFRKAGPPT